MNALGVVLHSLSEVTDALEKAGHKFSVYPKTSADLLVVQTVEQMFLVAKTFPNKTLVVLDFPVYFNNLNLKYVGSVYQGKGLHAKTRLVFPKKWPSYSVDKKLRSTRITFKNIKKFLKKGEQ